MEKSPALAALSALANETRLDILRLLVPAGARGLAAGEIASTLGASASRLSFHLATMEEAGLVRARREGRYQRYSVDFAQLGGLIAYLTNDCCRGHPAVCACIAEGIAGGAGAARPAPAIRAARQDRER